MTSLARVRRIERVISDWFDREVTGDPRKGARIEFAVWDGEVIDITALAEELDQALDGILADEANARGAEQRAMVRIRARDE